MIYSLNSYPMIVLITFGVQMNIIIICWANISIKNVDFLIRKYFAKKTVIFQFEHMKLHYFLRWIQIEHQYFQKDPLTGTVTSIRFSHRHCHLQSLPLPLASSLICVSWHFQHLSLSLPLSYHLQALLQSLRLPLASSLICASWACYLVWLNESKWVVIVAERNAEWWSCEWVGRKRGGAGVRR